MDDAMCLMAIQYQLVPEAPLLIAANREERYDRPSLPPSIQSGKPRTLCGTDQKSGGTWLGVNQHGLVVGASNRLKWQTPATPISRGILCRELLKCETATEAVDKALDELSTGSYDGVNFICADAESGWCVHGGDDINAVELEEGMSILANGDVNDHSDPRIAMAHRLLTLQTLDSPVKFLAVASKVMARTPSPDGRPTIVVRGKDIGTVSSTLVSLGKKPRDAIYQHAPGPPDRTRYEDYSPLLRDILSRGLRESQQKEVPA